ncbi:hypothetical protein MTO96_023772 [Rhipicephalus appendiculatus]
MECGRKKRMVLWAQATHLINECDQGWQVSLTVNEAGVLHTWWTSIRTELDTVNNEIDTLVSEDHLEEDYTQVIEYNDRIVQCLARLEQRTNAGLKQASPAPTAQAQPAHKVYPPTSRCYTDAKQLPKKRFGNEELLIQEHMKKLINVTPVRGLRHLYDTVSAHIRGLKTLSSGSSTVLAPCYSPSCNERCRERSCLTSAARCRSLVTDDMSIKQALTYQKHSNTVDGLVDLGGVGEDYGMEDQLAAHVLCFIFVGLSTHYSLSDHYYKEPGRGNIEKCGEASDDVVPPCG